MSTEVKVPVLPPCDFCTDGTKATYDAKTKQGPWAYLCEDHYQRVGLGLGTGRGQRLIVEVKP